MYRGKQRKSQDQSLFTPRWITELQTHSPTPLSLVIHETQDVCPIRKWYSSRVKLWVNTLENAAGKYCKQVLVSVPLLSAENRMLRCGDNTNVYREVLNISDPLGCSINTSINHEESIKLYSFITIQACGICSFTSQLHHWSDQALLHMISTRSDQVLLHTISTRLLPPWVFPGLIQQDLPD